MSLAKKRKGKKQNVLTCSIPGLPYEMDFAFPTGKLSVCDKCKKIYKTRKLCRERDGHTTFPWNKTYICFTLDESCFELDADGNERVVKDDGSNSIEFVAKHIECSPTKFFTLFDSQAQQLDPICAPCKLKNYTRTHCRVKHKHQNLPWSAVYMSLSVKKTNLDEDQVETQDENDENDENDEPKTPGNKRKTKTCDYEKLPKKRIKFHDDVAREVTRLDAEGSSHLYSEDRNDSKAFMMILCKNSVTLEWLSIEENIIVNENVGHNSPQCKICVTSTEEDSRAYDDSSGKSNHRQHVAHEHGGDWPIPQLGSIQSFSSDHSRPPSVNGGQFDWYNSQQQQQHHQHSGEPRFTQNGQYHQDNYANPQYYDQMSTTMMNSVNGFHAPGQQHYTHQYSHPMIHPNQYHEHHYQNVQEQYNQQNSLHPSYQQYPHAGYPYQNHTLEREYSHHHGGSNSANSVRTFEDGDHSSSNGSFHHQRHYSSHPGALGRLNPLYHPIQTNVVSPADTSIRTQVPQASQVPLMSNPKDFDNQQESESSRVSGSSTSFGHQYHHGQYSS